VNKTNRFTLIATVLLGVLLYMILRYARDLNIAWNGAEPAPPPAIKNPQTPAPPRIATTADLHDFLDAGGRAAATLLDHYADWSAAHGFTGKNRLFAAPDIAASGRYTNLAESELAARSEAGDEFASQVLATRRLFTDPFSAIEYFRRAAGQGSTFALLRIADLLEALDAAEAGRATTRSGQSDRARALAERGVDHSLKLTALGYLVTALRDGGPPVIDRSVLAGLDRLREETTGDQQVAVCEWSERMLLEIAKDRVRGGKPAITTAPPPVFFTPPDLAGRLPCRHTAYPIDFPMDLTRCTVTGVRDGEDQALDLYLCPGD